MTDKISFDEFNLALLYPAQRAEHGIALSDPEAKALVGDRTGALAYYATWKPDFTKRKKRRVRPSGPVSGWRTIFGWVMLLVLAAGIAFVGYSAVQGFIESTGEGKISFIDAAWAAGTDLAARIVEFVTSLTA